MKKEETQHMTFRLPVALHEAFLTALTARDETAAQVIRHAIRAYVKNNDPEVQNWLLTAGRGGA